MYTESLNLFSSIDSTMINAQRNGPNQIAKELARVAEGKVHSGPQRTAVGEVPVAALGDLPARSHEPETPAGQGRTERQELVGIARY